MPIKVACKCGQKFAAKDELAGKVVKCPKCEKPLKVPAATKKAAPVAAPAPGSGSLADLLDEAGLTAKHDDYQGRHCPSCNSPLAENALLCVGCGLNLETGRFIRGSGPIVAKDKAKQAEGHEGAAERLLSRAEKALVQEKVEQIKNVREGAPIWAIFCALVVLGTLAVSMSMMPRRDAFELSGWVCIIVCGIVQTACGLHLLVLAFKEDVLVGVLYLFVPFYSLYFVITRWSRCRQTFLIAVTAALASLLGVGMLWLATIVSEPSPDVGYLPPHTVPPAAVQSYDPLLTRTYC
ncbi:MAG: hypothetical protein EA424_27785 [Planctomycetaceae bacterium]|nr:MAG: hypothetical protein EA424_27785 [Planctomycetaceae bacterium]